MAAASVERKAGLELEATAVRAVVVLGLELLAHQQGEQEAKGQMGEVLRGTAAEAAAADLVLLVRPILIQQQAALGALGIHLI